jgi:phospholipid-translocating ATPase
LQWTKSSVSSFQTLKSTLLSKPVLITPSFDLPFIGQTDAGNKAIRAVLSQDISDVEHPIAFLSRKLLPREQNYSTVEKE